MRNLDGRRKDTTASVPALSGQSVSVRNANWKRRNWCAAGILVLYFLVNAIAISFYHFATPIQVDHNQNLVIEVILALSVVLTVMFFVTSWFWAQAKNWPGFIGAAAALAGAVVWLGCAVAVISPYNVSLDTNRGDPTIPVNNWLPLLPWVAFTCTSIILKVLPVRKSKVVPIPDAA